MRGINGKLGRYFERVFQILRNKETGEEDSRPYPDKMAKIIWDHVPASWRSTKIMREFGRVFHRRTRLYQERSPDALYTRFLRNRPLLNLIADLACMKGNGAKLNIVDLGCSKGAEIYSLFWLIRRRRPDLDISGVGVDISSFAIEEAEKGTYRHDSKELGRVTQDELDALFIREGDFVVVRDWIKHGISWVVEDAVNPDLSRLVGLQDIVLANNFLIHLGDLDAKACLQNIVNLVTPGGYLCLWNVDLGVKTKFVKSFGLKPISMKIEQVYEADDAGLQFWPWRYWGLEPIDKTRRNWMERYSFIYQVPPPDSKPRNHNKVQRAA